MPSDFLDLLARERRRCELLLTAISIRAEFRPLDPKSIADDLISRSLGRRVRAPGNQFAMADETRAIELLNCGYKARCRAKNCKARATIIARAADVIGRPITRYELCAPHADQIVDRERTKDREIFRRP
jgi:hypothetical protein